MKPNKLKRVLMTLVLLMSVFLTSSVGDAASYKKMIDVSAYDGYINWSKVKSSGVSAAILRAGYGSYTVDSQFRNNASNANKVGMPIGIYWFSYAYTVNQAKQEAKKCISTIKQYDITLPVYFDWEYDSMRYAKQNGVTPSRKLITNMCKAFCEEITKAGYKAGVYYNLDYRNNYIYVDQLKQYSQWFAYYGGSLNYKCDIWQYFDNGRVSGISAGQVDLDYLINDSLLGKIKKPTEKKPTKSTFKSYKVKIKPYELNVRTGPGTSYKIISQVKRGQTVTISKEKNGWGYVSAKKGWINVSSKYVTKVTTSKATNVKYYKKCAEKYSIVNGLNKINVNSSFSNRAKIAKANGISNYKGTYSQNLKLLKLLNEGKLKKA